jgi:hypothetical protein
MRQGTFGPMGGAGKIVEADETYIGRRAGKIKNKDERAAIPFEEALRRMANAPPQHKTTRVWTHNLIQQSAPTRAAAARKFRASLS